MLKVSRRLDNLNISGIKTANVFNFVIQETNNFTEEDVKTYKYALGQSGCSGPNKLLQGKYSHLINRVVTPAQRSRHQPLLFG